MFNNLVESDLHTQERVRKGWFFLGTLAAYALLFMILGVVSIYAYDAHLEEQTNEYIVTFVPPLKTDEPPAPRRSEPQRSTNNASSERHVSERTEFVDRVTNPNNVPKQASASPSQVPPLPAGDVVLSNRNVDAVASNIPIGPPGRNNGSVDGGGGRAVVDIPDAPPPPPRATPTPAPPSTVLKISQVLNGRAVSLPKPPYPPLALQVKASGPVNVQVLIDETGKVISAQAISGHPLLRAAAVQAARQARFSPTVLGDQPVKVSGVITYNFTL